MATSSKNSPCCVENVTFSKTRLSGQASSEISSKLNLARKHGDAGWSTLKCRRARDEHKRVSGFWSGRHWVSLDRSWLEHGCSLSTRQTHSFPQHRLRTLKKVQWLKNQSWLTTRNTKETNAASITNTNTNIITTTTNSSKNEYRNYCVNGECFYLVTEDIACCSWCWLLEENVKVYVEELG